MQSSYLFHRTRLKLAGTYAGVMSCILGACGLALYQVVVHDYRESIDQGLESVAWAVHDGVEPLLDDNGGWQEIVSQLSLTVCQPDTICRVQASEVDPLVRAASPVNYYLRLLNADGELIALGGINLEAIPPTSGKAYLQTVRGVSGRHFRQISLPLAHQGDRWGYVQVGRSLMDFDRHVQTLRLALRVGLPILIALVGWSSWWLAGLAMRPVYASYRQMQQFTSDAAHEFKTPLAAMRSTIEATQQTHLPPTDAPDLMRDELAKVFGVLQRQSARLTQLVNDLLLLAKLERQASTDEYSQRCNLLEIIDDLVEELAFLAIRSEVTLSLTTSEPERAASSQTATPHRFVILGNEAQLYRLFSNLIVNAIQATPPTGKVTIRLRQDEEYVNIQVIDTGIGIAPGDQTHIFDRFYRVNADRSRNTGGSGLGLAIVKAIVLAHQGTIQIHSEPGKGSQFLVYLPFN
jgi:signal transduction histidine kinase